jgi:hypothetical protein
MKHNLNNREDFLKSVLHKDTGFTAPKNYFNEAEDCFSSFLSENKLPKENGFKVPKSYFKDIENSIIEKVVPKKVVKITSLKRVLLKYIPIATAASIALFLSINYLNPSNSTKEVSFETLAQSDLENWIVDNSNELSDQDFVALLHSNIINENDFALTDIRNDDIEEYIIYSENTSLLNENY